MPDRNLKKMLFSEIQFEFEHYPGYCGFIPIEFLDQIVRNRHESGTYCTYGKSYNKNFILRVVKHENSYIHIITQFILTKSYGFVAMHYPVKRGKNSKNKEFYYLDGSKRFPEFIEMLLHYLIDKKPLPSGFRLKDPLDRSFFTLTKTIRSGSVGKVIGGITISAKESAKPSSLLKIGNSFETSICDSYELCLKKRMDVIKETQILLSFTDTTFLSTFVAISCENIIPMMVIEDSPYGTLESIIERVGPKFNVGDRLIYLFDICCGMDYLHTARVILRNLSPAGCVVSVRGIVKIHDFSMALAMDSLDKTRFNDDSMTIYQLRRTAPECLRSKPLYSTASDVWSFGVLLYELITNRKPFNEYDEFDKLKTYIKGIPSAPRFPSNLKARDKYKLLLESMIFCRPEDRIPFNLMKINIDKFSQYHGVNISVLDREYIKLTDVSPYIIDRDGVHIMNRLKRDRVYEKIEYDEIAWPLYRKIRNDDFLEKIKVTTPTRENVFRSLNFAGYDYFKRFPVDEILQQRVEMANIIKRKHPDKLISDLFDDEFFLRFIKDDMNNWYRESDVERSFSYRTPEKLKRDHRRLVRLYKTLSNNDGKDMVETKKKKSDITVDKTVYKDEDDMTKGEFTQEKRVKEDKNKSKKRKARTPERSRKKKSDVTVDKTVFNDDDDMKKGEITDKRGRKDDKMRSKKKGARTPEGSRKRDRENDTTADKTYNKGEVDKKSKPKASGRNKKQRENEEKSDVNGKTKLDITQDMLEADRTVEGETKRLIDEDKKGSKKEDAGIIDYETWLANRQKKEKNGTIKKKISNSVLDDIEEKLKQFQLDEKAKEAKEKRSKETVMNKEKLQDKNVSPVNETEKDKKEKPIEEEKKDLKKPEDEEKNKKMDKKKKKKNTTNKKTKKKKDKEESSSDDESDKTNTEDDTTVTN